MEFPVDALEEINAQDCEMPDADSMDVTEEAEGENEIEAGRVLSKEEGPTSSEPAYAVDLFTFARPISYYTCILENVGQSATSSNLIVLTRTAHPALLIAGRKQRLEVFSLVQGPKPHSLRHGQALMEAIFI